MGTLKILHSYHKRTMPHKPIVFVVLANEIAKLVAIVVKSNIVTWIFAKNISLNILNAVYLHVEIIMMVGMT